MVQVVLFINGIQDDSGDRELVPRIGETIVLDCGEMVKITEVNHDWNDPGYIQVNSVRVSQSLGRTEQ